MDATPTPPAPPAAHDGSFRLLSAPVLSWALFDFANTIFSFAVVTLYFNEWVIVQHDRPDWHVGLMSFVVGLVLVLVMPATGAISDQVGRRLPFLAAFTTLCVGATAVLGTVDSVTVALVVAGVAVFGFQMALSMYDPLLATVAPESHRGSVSGLGVGFGYVGVILASIVLGEVVDGGDRQQAFIPTAIMVAIFALPIFLFVREPRRRRGTDEPTTGEVVRRAMRQLVTTSKHIRDEHRDVGRFLLARFLYVDAVATVILFMTVYMDRVGDFSDSTKQMVIGVAMVSAAIGAFVAGRVVETRGPKFVLRWILRLAIVSLLAGAALNRPELVWVLGPAIGITLGGVWTSDRVFMMRLSPPEVRGEFFGIYNLVGKVSSGFGPLVLWGGSTWLLHERLGWSELAASRVSLVLLALSVVAGLLVLRPLSDAHRYDDAWDEVNA